MRVCVFCASSNAARPSYLEAARHLGERLAAAGHELVYGGGQVGLMGEVARAVHNAGGKVYGVIPERLKVKEGIAYHLADTMVVTDTMSERKHHMMVISDAFVVLPGGLGTLEELMEVLVAKVLNYHAKPIVLLNTDGFYESLLAVFAQFADERLLHFPMDRLLQVVDSVEDAMDILGA
jgi:uncharacterized protein (TIGR00730 family)